MFSPLISFITGLLFLVPVPSGVHSSDVSGMWKDNSVSGHQLEFFYENDQLFASSSLFSSEKVAVFSQGETFYMEDGANLIEAQYNEGKMLLSLRNAETTIHFQFDRAFTTSYLASNSDELANTALGSIVGFPEGKAKSTASIFRVFLYQGNELIRSQELNSETGFVFNQVPNGAYIIFFEAQGPTAVQPVPAYKTITIQNGEIVEANVVLE